VVGGDRFVPWVPQVLSTKSRLDQILVQRGFAPTREKAQALILSGQVFVNDQKADKAGRTVADDAAIRIAESLPYVSRGGVKLAAALAAFHIDLTGCICLDIGASTGGFTDCMLQRGAARVYAVDVGAGQLDWKLRNDPRVVVRDKVNARYLVAGDIGEPVAFISMDVSFISATMILPHLPDLLSPQSQGVVVLVKPQFEVGRGQVGKGGVVRDAALREQAVEKVASAGDALGFRRVGVIPSPITGASGNQEFLLFLTK
jgi:23S rRNA (cytidine1920-2'-O)/16S rRNA (cytidine1409-2'-O)-methyltransferase